MKQAVEVPQVGESVTSGILAVWNVTDGAFVNEGEEIFELETDKATLPVPAPVSGVITIKVSADEEVDIGAVVAEIDTDAAAPAVSEAAPAAEAAPATEKPVPASQESSPAATAADALSPAVRRALEEHGLDSATVAAAVTPSGKDGRLTKGDVESFVRDKRSSGAPLSPAPAASERPPAGGAERQERKKMTNLRRTIAENLVRSKQQSAHLTTFNEVDMSGIIAMRTRYKDRFEQKHGVRLGFMSFFVKAAQRALVEFPAVNAFVDGDEIIYNYFYNIGVAISTDAGLVVPVLKNADSLGFADIESKIADFAARARARRLLPDEFTGGTFSITNGGVFGSMLSTPIPNPPQTAILGMHAINKRAVVVDDEIVVRPMMYVALTYDHRIIDGRGAIGFLGTIKHLVEEPAQLLLDL